MEMQPDANISVITRKAKARQNTYIQKVEWHSIKCGISNSIMIKKCVSLMDMEIYSRDAAVCNII